MKNLSILEPQIEKHYAYQRKNMYLLKFAYLLLKIYYLHGNLHFKVDGVVLL